MCASLQPWENNVIHKGANKDKNNLMITQAANAASGRTGKATPASDFLSFLISDMVSTM